MATALICLDGNGTRFLGVWVPRADGDLDETFAGSPLQREQASGIVHAQPSALSWDEFCQQLAQRTPVGLWWESKPVAEGVTAQAVLDGELSQVQLSAQRSA